MPLPPGLAARLAKRGLLKKKQHSENQVEEIIAENYDFPNKKKKSEDNKTQEDELLLAYRGHEGCPNKYNIYHQCTTFCVTLWKVGILNPDPKYLIRKHKLLKEYPLSEIWKEVFDRGCGRYYFWNTETDEVSWYPPNHPKAKITPSAARIREARIMQQQKENNENSENETRSSDDEQEIEAKTKSNKTTKIQKRRKEKSLRENILDPMDPAAYSDCPKGTWSSGLENLDGKTGVDSTAAGPLYQMRPYPSPGSVLAANAKNKMKSNDKNHSSK